MTQLPDVVITGVGVVSPIGIGKEAFRESLRSGRSGVGPITRFDASRLPVAMGAEIREFDGKQYVQPRKSLKVMGREIQTAFAAASLAMADARLNKEALEPDRTGVVFGSESISGEFSDVEDVYRSCLVDGEFDFRRWGEQAMVQIYPLWMLKYLPNMPACHVAIAYDARGPNNSIVLGEASSLLAVMEGVEIIRRGSADLMIVGGSSSRLNLADILWRGDSHLSHRLDAPAAASRPFDADRDGMVIGEGAAVFVIERRQRAEQRQAEILAGIAGWASTFEPPRGGYRATSGAIRRAIVEALRQADLAARRHRPCQRPRAEHHRRRSPRGGGHPADPRRCARHAPKSFFGNLGAGGGAVEMVASVLSFADRQVPFTLNYAKHDPACPINVIRDQPLASDKPTALLLNHSGTGQAAALVLTAV